MNKGIKLASLILGACLLVTGTALEHAGAARKKKKLGDVFFIYADRGSRLNHYIPSGWMGDYGDVKINQGWTKGIKKPASKKDAAALKAKSKVKAKPDTCIQFKYSGERKQGAGWSGVYWQHPANNWGDKRGGFDLSKYAVMRFWAKGETGEEVVDKIFIGGITGQTHEGDSDEASISPLELTKDWELYEIDLEGLDMSHIIGGFGVAANADANPDGFTIYIDEVRLEVK